RLTWRNSSSSCDSCNAPLQYLRLSEDCRSPYTGPMRSDVFETETLTVPGGTETVLRGGRHLFPLLPQAFHGVRRIGVIGWGPQGRAQAKNLRDSLSGTEITVSVGLRPDSPSRADARAHGF